MRMTGPLFGVPLSSVLAEPWSPAHEGGGRGGEDHFLCNKGIGLFNQDSESKAPMMQVGSIWGEVGEGISEGGLRDALE